MPRLLTEAEVAAFWRDCFHFPVRVLESVEARLYRDALEAHEAQSGGPIASNRRHKVHLLFTWAAELVRHPRILDAVEDLIGPDILCWGSSFFIKEARNPAFVSWHQDATYWGLDPDDVVTAWVAFSDAPVESGAMEFLPGSHRMGQLPHADTFHEHNLLSRGQEIAVEVDAEKAEGAAARGRDVAAPRQARALQRAEHHGRPPHRPRHRYIPPHVQQLKVRDSATLVRGRNTGGHYDMEPVPEADLDAAALAAHADAMKRQVAALYAGTDRQEFRA